MSTSQQAAFVDALQRLFPAVLPEQAVRLVQHYELLKRWNTRLNLTRVVEFPAVVERHYAESLLVAAELPAGEWKIADIGSGAGFPGIPVAVARPECGVTLIESHQRKSVFLREATRDLANVQVLSCRAEDVAAPFDWITSRAIRIGDLTPLMDRLGANAALLAGPAELPAAADRQWTSIPIPWSRQRFLHIGIVTRARRAANLKPREPPAMCVFRHLDPPPKISAALRTKEPRRFCGLSAALRTEEPQRFLHRRHRDWGRSRHRTRSESAS